VSVVLLVSSVSSGSSVSINDYLDHSNEDQHQSDKSMTPFSWYCCCFLMMMMIQSSSPWLLLVITNILLPHYYYYHYCKDLSLIPILLLPILLLLLLLLVLLLLYYSNYINWLQATTEGKTYRSINSSIYTITTTTIITWI